MKGGARTVGQWMVLAASIVVLGWQCWAYRWVADDGFIYLRIVRQLEAGNGPVFNAGQRVEAFTSPLWLFGLWIADRLIPLRLEWIAVGLGILLSLAGVAFAIAGAMQLSRHNEPRALFFPAGLAVLVCFLPMWFFGSAGLETGMVFAWIGACLWLLARWAGDPRRRLSASGAMVIGLGWLVRPELGVYSAAFVVLVTASQWRADTWRDRIRLLALMFGLPVAYQLFRMGYFGNLVANTAIAKEASRPRWGYGWQYLKDFVAPYRLWIPLVILAVGAVLPLGRALRAAGERRSLALVAALELAALLNALYIIRVGGDYIHGRLLMPALFAALAPVTVVPASRRYLAAALVIPWAVVCGFHLRPSNTWLATDERPFIVPWNQGEAMNLEHIGWNPGGWNRTWYKGPALYALDNPFNNDFRQVEVRVAPDLHLPTVVLYGIGLPSYALGPQFDVVDMLSLADPLGAHLELVRRGLAGHEKEIPAVWIAARLTAADTRPRASDFAKGSNPLIPATTGAAFDEKVAWARAAARCPSVQELERSTKGPLTVGQFFTNLAHSLAHTRLRIPPDPEAAYHRFCGADVPAEVLAARDAR